MLSSEKQASSKLEMHLHAILSAKKLSYKITNNVEIIIVNNIRVENMAFLFI